MSPATLCTVPCPLLRRALPSVWGLALCAESLPDSAEPRPPVEPRPLRQASAPVLSHAHPAEPRPPHGATPPPPSHALCVEPRLLITPPPTAQSLALCTDPWLPRWSPTPSLEPPPCTWPHPFRGAPPPPPQRERGVSGCRTGYSQDLASLLRARSVATWEGGPDQGGAP